MSDTGKPQFRHDCEKCDFLGRYVFEGPLRGAAPAHVWVDLYACGEGPVMGPSLICRMSDEGSNYCSMAASVMVPSLESMRAQPSTHSPGIVEAFDRARKTEKHGSIIEEFVKRHEAAEKRQAELHARLKESYAKLKRSR